MPEDVKLCSRCHAALGEGATFCSKCGAPVSQAAAQAPRSQKQSGRALAAGLMLVWLGVFFYLTQTVMMPAQLWWAYLVAGLGVVIVIWGIVRYSHSHFLAREGPAAQFGVDLDRKRTGKFSAQLGVEHKALLGKKMLFEFDPSTPYQKVIRDFALECVFNKETIIVLTPSGSVIQRALEGDEGVKVINLTHDTMLSPILEENAERPLNLIYDSLTDLALSTDSRTAYRFAMNSLRQLSDPRTTALFLLNPSAHEPKDVSSLRGLFSSQVFYGKEGMSRIKFA